MLQEKITPGLQLLLGRGPPIPPPTSAQLTHSFSLFSSAKWQSRAVWKRNSVEYCSRSRMRPRRLRLRRHRRASQSRRDAHCRGAPPHPAIQLCAFQSLPTPSPAVHLPCLGRLPPPAPPTVDLADFTAPVTLARGGAKHRKGVHGEQLSCARVEIRGDWWEGVPLRDLSSRSSRLRGA